MEHNFKYGPYRFTLKLVEDLVQSSDNMGITHFNDQLVVVDSGLKDDVLRETILHELLHVLLRDIGTFHTADAEENFIRLLSPRMAQLFGDNKEITKMVFGLNKENHGKSKNRKSRK